MNRDEEHVDDDLWTIQTNLDDMNPEIYPYLMDRLFEIGAKDVYLIPIIMKKGRPGIILNVLASFAILPQVEAIIFRESSTLGLRYWKTQCHRLQREIFSMETPWGKIRLKLGYFEKECVQFAPEYEDCAKAASQHKIPLQNIYDFIRQHFPQTKTSTPSFLSIPSSSQTKD